jgi:predicted CXXCH cytochrome family protein
LRRLEHSPFRCLSFVRLVLTAGVFAVSHGMIFAKDQSATTVSANDPNIACASCHRQIYERYRYTPMANASGEATVENLIPGDFTHSPSGIHYRIFAEDQRVWLSYDREHAPASSALHGRQHLQYVIGSGKRGKTFLFEQEGYWFEAPINWYEKTGEWDMAPNYLSTEEMPLTLPVDPGCLHCHTSQVAESLPDARNHYAAAPFAAGGITCTKCHGDADAHLASGGKVSMLKLDSLETVKRNSICLSCHLEGQTAVVHEGHQLASFRPGDNLFDGATYFVRSGEIGSGGRATSQWEALLESACLRRSGNRMTCTTCHDPHGSPSAAERVSFYRNRCLQCHNQGNFVHSHHPENPDCVECHLSRASSSDIAHEQVTDHRIVKHASSSKPKAADTGPLLVVGGFATNDRDLGIAYAQLSRSGDQEDAAKAMSLLHKAEKEKDGALTDHELHDQLGFLEQVFGDIRDAATEYREALRADVFDSLAAGNLALIEAQQHHYEEAIHLWETVFSHDPAQLAAGMNLAIVDCGEGKKTEALETLDRVLTFSPDNQKARSLATRIRSGNEHCGRKN